MDTTISAAKRFFVSGQPFEIWENPDHPFGWTPRDLSIYENNAEWELLFNALITAIQISVVIGQISPEARIVCAITFRVTLDAGVP